MEFKVNPITTKKYKIDINESTKVILLNNDYVKSFDIYNDEVYVKSFPVIKSYNTPTLECKLTINAKTGDVAINVYKYNTKEYYYPFYSYQYGNYEPLIQKINSNIKNEFKKVGIHKV